MRESRMTRNGHVRFGERGRETRLSQGRKVRSAPTLSFPYPRISEGAFSFSSFVVSLLLPYHLWRRCYDDRHCRKQECTDAHPERHIIATEKIIEPPCRQRSQASTEGNRYALHSQNGTVGRATELVRHDRCTERRDSPIGSAVEDDIDDEPPHGGGLHQHDDSHSLRYHAHP